jgi:hypothetical protein
MKLKTIETIFRALNREEVRYLIAGGLAVVAHGHMRFTADIDLILDMEEKNLQKAISVFSSLGYLPRPPVALENFSNPAMRATWMQEKGLKVFSLWNPDHPATEIDLFIEPPIDFEQAYSRNISIELAEDVDVTVIGFDDLILIKRLAGRERDFDDIEKLMSMREGNHHE